jgi:metal-sulfur cluster biosynthetic enzyme
MSDDLLLRVTEALRTVIDPELGENVVDLGLVYDICVDQGAVRITMTATTPGCPATGFLKDGAAHSVDRVVGVKSVDVTMTFEPRWTPARISPAARTSLGFANVN